MQVVHEPGGPVRLQAVEAIRQDIIAGRMPPGYRLIERELCERLGLSRNTLREAYRQLEAEGFLEIRPHRGPVVASMERDRVMDLYEVREALETLAVRLFTVRATREQFEALELAFERFSAAVVGGDVSLVVSAKDEFYDSLYAGSGNEELHAQARMMFGRLAGLRLRSLSTPGRPHESLAEMRQVIMTMKSNDAEGAAELWAEHVHNAASAALNSLQQDSDSGAVERDLRGRA
jgi:DNA-binding GntR family transcriptional regulator